MKWLLLALCNCNWIYGLDETELAAPFVDLDNDGVDDARDNCPVPNHDQLDTDGDDIGDACDGCHACAPCDTEPKDHDEDGDSIADGCDPCPVASPGLDADADGLEDRCDTGPESAVVLFDGFPSISDRWDEVGARWAAESDRAHPAPQTGSSPYRLQYETRLLSGNEWFIEVGIGTPDVLSERLGIDTIATEGLPRCHLLFVSANRYRLETAGGQIEFDGPLPPDVALRMSGTANQMIHCEIVGTNYKVSVSPMDPVVVPLQLQLHAENPASDFAYVLVAE